MRDLRGREMSMIFQNPRAALNPIRKVGHQIGDVLLHHLQAAGNVKEKVIEILEQVRSPAGNATTPIRSSCPAACASASSCACARLPAATDDRGRAHHGLDVTTQKAVMDLVTELTRARGMSTILITHDLGLAASYCDTVMVMEKGVVVETAPASRSSAIRSIHIRAS